MRGTRRYTALLLTCGALLATSANAAQILVDFTDRTIWGSSGAGAVTRSYGDLQVTLQAFNGGDETTYSNTAYDGVPTHAACSFLACRSDGVGVRDDEVSYGDEGPFMGERLTVSFSRAVSVDMIAFFDFFSYMQGSDPYAEQLQVSVNGLGGAWGVWSANATDSTGYLGAAAANADLLTDADLFSGVWSLDFYAAGEDGLSIPQHSDFALAAIQITTVPEPTALSLLGLGMLAFGFARRPQRSRAS
jgi:hypothetical protein